MDRTRNLDNYLPPASSGSTAIAGIVLWIVAGICLLLTFRSATAVQQCAQACGGGCVEAGGRHVECGGHGEACFDFCRTQRDEKDCIQKRHCIEEADKEWHKVQACEKEQECDLQGLLGTGKGFALMSALASVLPVLGTICLSLFQEPFQMDASVLRDLYCSDYIARAMWLFGVLLTLYVAWLLIATLSPSSEEEGALVEVVAGAFALTVNCGACFCISLARCCLAPNGYEKLPQRS
ncbi:unnamed protein product [Symbiodinium necroappetens]|uniref:Transmembrane protein n=2 Tax=Symbiodinium TaxID=2949 RepID=A0A812QDA2_9DINO|nr:hypothetical protein AK812_SmicGene22413 [Symbiodinium microadriaticum]CAE7365593.1 unnamed protein product [Symbiodinium necroappetens]